jgi:cytochrome c5
MWRATVRRMIERNEAPVSEQDGERIIDWLTDYRSFSDGWMFRARCERCHGRQHLREVPRTAEEWSWIVRRVSWISPFAFRADQQEQVDRYVRAELASPEPQPGSAEAEEQEQRLLLQRSCNPCHSISLILEEGALDDVETMIRRMARKNPDVLPPDRVDDLVEAVLAVPTDEEAFRRAFPHDILRETER